MNSPIQFGTTTYYSLVFGFLFFGWFAWYTGGHAEHNKTDSISIVQPDQKSGLSDFYLEQSLYPEQNISADLAIERDELSTDIEAISKALFFNATASKVNSSPTRVGQNFTYTVGFSCPSTVDNNACTNVVLTDPLPAGIEFVVGAAGVTYDDGTRIVSYTFADVPNGGTRQVTFTVTSPEYTVTGTQVDNIASIQYTQGATTATIISPTNTVTLTNGVTLVNEAEIIKGDIDVNVSSPGELGTGNEGQQIFYGSRSSNTISNFVIEDIIPPGLILRGNLRISALNLCNPGVNFTVEVHTTDNTWRTLGTNYFGASGSFSSEVTYNMPNNVAIDELSTYLGVSGAVYPDGIRLTYPTFPGGGCANPDFRETRGQLSYGLYLDPTRTGENPVPTAGTSEQNCADLTASSFGGIAEMDCGDVNYINGNQNLWLEKEDITGSASYQPFETISFRVTGGNAPNATVSEIVDPYFIDLIPPGFTFQGVTSEGWQNTNNITNNPGSSSLNPVFSVINDYGGEIGRTALIWEWNAANNNSITLGVPTNAMTRSRYEIEYDVTVDGSTSAGNYNNGFFFTASEAPSACLGAMSNLIVDTDDVDQDGDMTESICRNVGRVTVVIPNGLAGLDSRKEVNGNLDAPTDFSRFPDNGMVSADGDIIYRFSLSNPLATTVEDIVLVDVFPHIGDIGVVARNETRDSEWRPVVTSTTVTQLQNYVNGITGATLYFSTACEPCLNADLGNPVVDPVTCTNPNWSTSVPANEEDICAFKIEYGSSFTIATNQSTTFDITLAAPSNVPTGGEIAWNSFGFTGVAGGTPLLASEPIKVGIASFPPPCTISGSIQSQICNNNSTNGNPLDDFYDMTVSATITNGSSTYEVLVDGQPLIPKVTGTSGLNTSFTIPASGSTAEITFRDDADNSCVSPAYTTTTLNNCSDCTISGSIVSQVCNDMGTGGNAADDVYDITVNATITDGSSTTYEVLVDGNPLNPTVTATSGQNASFTLPAGGGTASISFRDNSDGSCVSSAETTTTLTACSDCTISGSIVSQVCNDMGTGGNAADDVYDITVNATITDGSSTTYEVLVDGNPLNPTVTATSGQNASFTLPAGGGTASISFRDNSDGSCVSSAETTTTLTACSTAPTCSISGSIVSQLCNDMGTGGNAADDVYDITVNATITDGSSTMYEVLVDGSPLSPTVTATSGQNASFTLPAGGGTASISYRDNLDASCVSTAETTTTLTACSDCTISGSIVSQDCNDMGTGGNAADDVYDITVNATITDGSSTMYEVLVDGNPLSPTVTATSGQNASFTLPAGGGTASISYRDNSDASCVSTAETTTTLTACSDCTISGSIVSQDCNDMGTGGNAADDVYDITVNATITDGSSTMYEVLVDGNPLSPTVTATSGQNASFTLPAGGGTASISYRDNSDASCVSTAETTTTLTACSDCTISGSIVSQDCNDMGTGGNAADDVYDITVNATITDGSSTTYEVLVDGNPLSPPVTATSGQNASFTLPAGGGTASISYRDNSDASCVSTAETTTTLTACSDCTISGSIVSQDCNDMGTGGNAADDVYDITVNATITDGSSTTYEVLVDGSPLSPTVTATSGQNASFTLPAGGGTASISYRDNLDASCVSSAETTTTLTACSDCSITGTIVSETCNDNNTGGNTSDDFYQIRVTATLAGGTSTNYEVLVDGNPLSPALFAPSGTDTVFTLPANGSTADITFRDAGDPSCISVVETTNTLANCSVSPCSITGSIISETCNDNMTVGVSTDDTYDIVVNATLTNGTSPNYEVLVDGNPLSPVVTAPSGTNASINLPASGSPAAISFRDAGDATCVSSVENTGTLNSCYDCEVVIDIVEVASCVGNNFDVTTTVNWTNAPIGDLEFSIDGGNTFNTLGRPSNDVDAAGVELELVGLVCNQTKSFIIRFAGQPGCFAEGVFLFPPADPAGYIYCAETGEIITGGTVSVTPPVGGTFEFIVSGGEELDGSNGRYEWIATGSPVTAGRYTMSFTPPAELSLAGTPGAVAFGNGDDVLDPNDITPGGDNPDSDDPLLIGEAINGAGTALVDFSAAANPFFFEFDLENSDPFVDNNNIPVTGCFRDYGDLPDFGVTGSYATDINDNGEGVGAAHVILPNFNIGASIDNESDGQPSTTALGDANGGDDEDGVTLPNNFYTGQTGVEVPVTVEVPSGTDGQLICWIDWNGDGILSPGEAVSSSIITGNTGTTQTVTLTFDVPVDAVTVRPLGARFRLFDATETSQSSTGTALLGGEVEDYLIGVRPCPSNNCR